jgi:hypothetical protein
MNPITVEDIEEDTYRSFNRSKRSAATPNTEA